MMKKNSHETESLKKEYALIFSQKELILGCALFVFSLFFVFAGGYFLGKKNALEELALQYDDESFADKVSQSLSGFYDQQENAEPAESVEISEEDIEDKGSSISGEESIVAEANAQLNEVSAEKAYANLCGFSSAELAYKYGGKLLKRGIQYQIFERKSKSKKNKIIVWYQVATEVMDKQALLNLIEKISKEDKLVDVCIIDVEPV